VAGITLTTPNLRYTRQRSRELIRMVVEAAEALSFKLGYQPEIRYSSEAE
jgi:DNA-binding IclR family transcriptional regulator